MALEGKVALVTGSSEGIGRAISLRLAGDGADICVNYRHAVADAEAVREKIEGTGRRAIAVQADVSKLDDVRRLVGKTVSQLGRLDILVNNAGIEIEQPFLEVTEESYDRVLKAGCGRSAWSSPHTRSPSTTWDPARSPRRLTARRSRVPNSGASCWRKFP